MYIEFETIRDMLLRIGYPLPFIQNQICRFLNNKHSDLNISNKMDKQATHFILRLPFIGNASLHIEKELKSCFRCPLSGKLSLKVMHDCYKIGDMFKHKELQPKLYRHNVVYKLTCSCSSVYIGQTLSQGRPTFFSRGPNLLFQKFGEPNFIGEDQKKRSSLRFDQCFQPKSR